MATITGKDELSLKILNELRKGTRVKDIPNKFPVSLDQTKRLSRYNNMYQQIKDRLSSKAISNFKSLGLKALYLSDLFKTNDWEGLEEILLLVDGETKRKDLKRYIEGLNEKRRRIDVFKDEANKKIKQLEENQQELKKAEQKIKETEKKINQTISFLSNYEKRTQQFLLKHLGLYEDQLVLSRRLDSLWQKNLKKKGILKYDSDKYLWYVVDLDGFAKDYERRINRKNPYNTEWNYENEKKRNKNSWYNPPTNPKYRLPDGLAEDLQQKLRKNILEQKKIKEQIGEIQAELKGLKATSPQSFLESVEASDTFSEYELKRHGELQHIALKWLYEQNYIAISEFTLPNNRRVDCIGYNKDGEIIIIEVKVTQNDFLRDEKWETYLDYCDKFYFLLDFYYIGYTEVNQMKDAGFLKITRKNSLIIEKEDTMAKGSTNKEELIWKINQVLSRKYIYGY